MKCISSYARQRETSLFFKSIYIYAQNHIFIQISTIAVKATCDAEPSFSLNPFQLICYFLLTF